MSRSFLVVAITLLVASGGTLQAQSSSPTGTISGSVVNRVTQQPISGATIALMDAKLGAVSKPTGMFLISNIPPGTYRVRISSLGYEARTIADVSVRSGHETQLPIDIIEKEVQLESATITAPLFERSADNITSTHNFNYEEVRRAPGAAEDVSRIAQSMPGVSFSNDGRNDLVVRGGSPSENLTIVDGIEVPNINHFGTQGASGGPIGMVDVNFINDVQFSGGGFRSEFGDKLSSVLTISLREGNRNGFQGNVNLSTAGVGTVLEGPIGSGSYLFSVRRSYLNLIHNLIGLSAIPNYQDLQTKIVFEPDPSHKLSFLLLAGYDKITFDGGNADSTGLQFANTKLDQWQGTSGITWRWLWGNSGYSDAALFVNHVDYTIFAGDEGNARSFSDSSRDTEYGLRLKAAWQASRTVTVTAGGTAKIISARDAIFVRRDSVQVRTSDGTYRTQYTGGVDGDTRATTSKLALFADAAATFGSAIVTAGGRLDHFAYLTGTNTVISPRLSASFALSPTTTVSGSVGIFHQAPELVWLTSVPSNRALSYMRADHFIAGIAHDFDDDLRFTIEGYVKNYSNYPVSLSNPYFVLANGGSEYGASIPGAAHSTGSGVARGVDLFLQKKLVGSLYGSIAYSYSTIRYEADSGGPRPGAYDYRSVFTLIAGYTIGSAWEFSVKWRYAGGRPYTPFDVAQSEATFSGVRDVARYNLERLPVYHRLDVRIDQRSSFSWGNIVAFVELQNVYNRENILQYYWDNGPNAQGKILQWAFVPIGGVKVEF